MKKRQEQTNKTIKKKMPNTEHIIINQYNKCMYKKEYAQEIRYTEQIYVYYFLCCIVVFFIVYALKCIV